MSRGGGLAKSGSTLRRFTGNTLAMVAAGFILLSIVLAVAGYLITPDATPLANKQFLEISRKKPGFSVLMLRVQKNFDVPQRHLPGKMIFGQDAPYEEMPVDSVQLLGSTLLAYPFSNSTTSVAIEMDLADVLFMTQPDSMSRIEGSALVYYDISSKEVHADYGQARDLLFSEHLRQTSFLLGTDRFGRDMLSQLLIGMRVSLSVGFMAVIISLVIGVLLGALAGYFGGRTDTVVMWLINVVWSLPSLLLVIAITFALGKGFWQVFLAIGFTMWVEVARVVRGQIMSVREKEYVEAARALGFSDVRIMFRHILPNVFNPVIVVSAANFATAILIEAGLSFLGIGVQPPMPSWGTMIRDHAGYIILDSAFLAFLPGFAIMLMVLAFMVAGNGLRDALDVKT